MMDLEKMPEYMQDMIVDYPIRLLEVRSYPYPERFKTDLQFVFGFLKYAEDKEKLAEYVEKHKEVFSELNEKAYDLISCMSKSAELKMRKQKYQEEKGGIVDMCQAITEMIADGEKRGETRFANLTQTLIKENRIDTLLQAAADKKYRDQLYIKYQI